MILFIQNIPVYTKNNEMIKFVRPALKNRLLIAKGKIADINKLVIKGKDTTCAECHGLVTIEPDEVALKAISKLEGKRFFGKRAVVRQYIVRTKNPTFRFNERRRHLEKVVLY